MWRDILIILAFVFAWLTYFGLTPRRLAKYAGTAKGEITKRSRIRKFFLFFVIAMTPVFIFTVIWRFEMLGLVGFLAMIAVVLLLWLYALIDVWKLKLSQRGVKVVNVVRNVVVLAGLSLLMTSTILRDIPLWQKFASPLIGIAGGVGIHYLNEYVNKKLEGRHPSREGDK